MKVLIAEDDPNILRGVAELLTREGYVCIETKDGKAAIEAFAQNAPDLVVLDIMMPKKSGYDVCRAIREQNARVPVIFLSAKSEEIDKVVGLELGADDYVMKPFGARELLARIRSVVRRSMLAGPPQTRILFEDVEFFPERMLAVRDGEEIELSLRETKLLALFAEKRGLVLDRDTIFTRCWGPDHYPNSRTLDQAIMALRKKIERDPKNPKIIRTAHGVGYMVS
jgi:DNA-binding response OmpR family regulator